MPDLPSFAVVIPMYNEETGAEECVRQVCGELSRMAHRAVLITVNDGSRDGTGEVLRGLAPQCPNLTVVTHPQNRGYGAALRTGVMRAQQDGFDYVLFMDSDLTNHPRDIPRFASCMEEKYDVIKATRYSKGGSVSGVPAYRVWISRLANGLAHWLFRLPVRDCTNGFRAARVDLLARMDLKENRFPIIMEELYWSKFLAGSFAEVPVVLTNRVGNRRPTSFAYRPSVFWHYLKYPILGFLHVKPKGLA
jgi:glycosyltransferase involved in cell wall biosynthesis